MGFMPNIKKAKQVGFGPVFGSDAFPAVWDSELLSLGYPVPEALGFSTATIPAFLEHSSSIPSEVSAPKIFLEKSSAPSNLEGAAATLFSSASGGFVGLAIKTGSLSAGSGLVSVGASPSAFSGVLSGAAALGVRPAAFSLVRPAGGDPPLPSSSKDSSGLLGAAW